MGGQEGADQGAPMPPRGRRSLHWRKDPTILRRLAEVERRHLAGQMNIAIAADLGVDETTIRRDVQRLRELWLEQTKAQTVEMRAQRLKELADIKRRAIEAAEWDRLCEEAVLFGAKLNVETATGPLTLDVYRDHKGSAQFRGNKAAALSVARQATMDAAKLEGLVVDKVSPTDADGKTLDIATLMQRAREHKAKGDTGEGDGGGDADG